MYSPSFWFDVRVYLAVAAGLLLVIAFYNPYAWLLGIVLLYALYKYGQDRYAERQKEMSEYLKCMAGQVEKAANDALQNLPLAIVIINAKGEVHWRNSVITAWLQDLVDPGQSFLKFFPDLDPEKTLAKLWGTPADGQFDLKRGGATYHVVHKMIFLDELGGAGNENTNGDNRLMILYITDITDFESLRLECQNSKPVVAYIQIDNYDDVLKGLTESQRAGILGEVNEYLAEWINELDGFIKKLSEDTYVAVLNNQALDKLISAGRFEILEKVRSIQGGNKIPVTLSMGIAAGAGAINSLSQAAQAGLDLALGRGGDQAAVDINNKFQFFGGKAKAVEKNTRVRARIVAQTLHELIGQADNAIVMGHVEEDFDSLGAAMGVAKMVRHLGKDVRIVISKAGAAADKLSELMVDYESYLSTFISPEKALSLANSRTLLFIVDIHRPELVAAPAILSKCERRVVIDHHRRAETFIDHPLLVYLEPSASSTSELVTELLPYFSDTLALSQIESSALYAGIVLDTKNFTVQTGVRTFEAASYLRRAGADPALSRQLFRMDMETFKYRAAIISNAEVPLPGIAVSVCPIIFKEEVKILVAQAADLLLSIDGIKASFVLYRNEEEVGVSARSNGDVNVQLVMEKFGGGGHQSAAAAKIKNQSLTEVRSVIVDTVADLLKESAEKS